jgi:signal recognition particle receptor subunit beta
LLVATLLPIIIHVYLYNTSKSGKSIPTFLLIGPSGAGKTSLLTLVSHSAHHTRNNTN